MKNKRILSYILPVLFVVLLLIVAAYTGGVFAPKPEPGEPLRADFIDVGKGDCILVRSPSYTMLIDTGYEETSDKVLSYLEKEKVDSLDTLVVTHFDKDHAGGVASLLSEMSIGEIYAPAFESVKDTYELYRAAVSSSGVTEYLIKPGECTCLEKGKLDIVIEAPDIVYDPNEKKDNDMSLMLRIDNSRESWLFLGDIEKHGIRYFLDDSQICKLPEGGCYSLVKMPRHGGIEDNSDKLAEYLGRNSSKDALAVITDSTEKKADSELIALLEENGFDHLSTSEEGDIVVSFY